MALRCAYFNGFGRGTSAAKEAAEKRHLPCVLKGRTFRCAVQVLSSCHSEWASAHEESAFRTFSAASKAGSRKKVAWDAALKRRSTRACTAQQFQSSCL